LAKFSNQIANQFANMATPISLIDQCNEEKDYSRLINLYKGKTTGIKLWQNIVAKDTI